MKILLFHQYYLGKNDPGGSRWNQFSKVFSKDNQISVLAGNIHYATGKRVGLKIFFNREQISENIQIYRTWTYSGYNANFLGRLIGYLSYTLSSLIAALFIKKPDLIIVTSPPLFVGLSALVISKIKRIPFIFEVRDLWPESAIATQVVSNRFLINIMYWIERTLYNNSSKIVVLTPAFKKNIVERFPVLEKKIEIITNGADFDLVKPGDKNNWVREKYKWGNKKVFSYFGAHGIANDLTQVIEVARLFKTNTNILFALIGDGMQKKQLKGKVLEYELNNVQFIDSVPKDQVVHYISASDVCMAILKKTDTFKTVYPNKIFDYMAGQKPIIVTIDGITRELIENSKSGLYSEPGNIPKFKESIDFFLRMNENDLYNLGNNGYQYVITNFDRQELANRYLNLFKSIN